MDDNILHSKLALMPDHLKLEDAGFIDFLVIKEKKTKEKKRPGIDSGKGMFVLKPGFDEPLEDFKEYMYWIH